MLATITQPRYRVLRIATLATLSPLMAVNAQSPPPVSIFALTPGTYWSPKGATCTVQNLALSSGRVQSQMTCRTDSKEEEPVTISIGNGTISTGHPYETQLKRKGIDKRSDVGNYSWGVVMNAGGRVWLGGCGPFDLGNAVGIQQFGDQILVSLNDGSGGMSCTGTLERLTP